MSGGLIRTLAALALIFTASNAMAQSSGHVMEYRWLTLFGEADFPMPTLESRGGARSSVFESILSRAFLTLETDDRLAGRAANARYFRDADPEFGYPAALRRPRQARLSFSVRF